jgi:hypothetical protein
MQTMMFLPLARFWMGVAALEGWDGIAGRGNGRGGAKFRSVVEVAARAPKV